MPKSNPESPTKKRKKVSIITEPYGEAFKFAATLKVDWNKLIDKLSTVPKAEIVQMKDAVALVDVKSRDIDGVPYQFTVVYLRKNEIEVIYSITPETSRKKRQLEVIRYISNLLTILTDCYSLDLPSFMQLLDRFIADMDDYVSMNYDKLYTKYDTLLTQYNELRKKIMRLKNSNDRLSKDLVSVRKERDELSLRLQELEKYSDEALMLKIQDWVREHEGVMDIAEFSKLYKVNVTRVEQILNKMVREGYLEVVR